MPSSEKFYITTAIAYVNAAPHLGFALELIMTDAIARYKRLSGRDVYFLTGTDEHGVKMYNTARKEGVETKALADRNAKLFQNLKGTLNLSNDDFIRTSDEARHWPACQKLWTKLKEAGDIYEKEYEGLYCEGCELFMKETELVNGLCPIHKKPLIPLKERNYFFRLSKYSDKIANLVESDTVRIIPESRKAEFLNLAKDGLHDVSFSRPREVLPWGVPVPDDPDQVMYVWCDALTNYMSAIGYAEETPHFKKYWPADVHVIGKDIVRFHAGYWIGMLLSAELPLPKSILIHGFISHNGEKMSKTLGNVVDPVAMVEKYGTDPLRYYLLREIPTGRDGDFSDELFVERYNADLANNLGNLVNRLHTLISRNSVRDFDFSKDNADYQGALNETWDKYIGDMQAYSLNEAIFHIWKLIDFCNKKLEDEKPWTVIKEDRKKAVACLTNLLELVRHISIMIQPFLPETSDKIRGQLGLPAEIAHDKESGWGSLSDWKTLGEAEIIFPRIEA